VSGLAASTSYSFSVRAADAAGNVSGASNAVAVTTLAATGGGGAGGTPTVTITNAWDTGYCATLAVANNTASSITWQVTFTVQGHHHEPVNGTFTQSGSSATVSVVSWNAVAPARAEHEQRRVLRARLK